MFDLFKRGGKREQLDVHPIVTISGTESSVVDSIKEIELEEVSFAVAFVSADVSFESAVGSIKNALPAGVKFLACTDAGRLTSEDLDHYQTRPTAAPIVLQAYSSELISDVSLHNVKLHNNDKSLSKEQRVEKISREISNIIPSFQTSFNDTVGFTLIDGLSASESFFAEAVFKSQKLPFHIMGGSAGGSLSFDVTKVFDGEKVQTGVAALAILKVGKEYTFDIHSHHNFALTNTSFKVVESSLEDRWVKQVMGNDGQITTFTSALMAHFSVSDLESLSKKLTDYSFAIKIDGVPMIRSVAAFDADNDRVNFYCDVAAGDTLYLVKRESLSSHFEKAKGQVRSVNGEFLGGIAVDCILRRLNNSSELNNSFWGANSNVIGFSSFGEFWGLNNNETQTGLYFYKTYNATSRSKSIEDFPFIFASQTSYFSERES